MDQNNAIYAFPPYLFSTSCFDVVSEARKCSAAYNKLESSHPVRVRISFTVKLNSC